MTAMRTLMNLFEARAKRVTSVEGHPFTIVENPLPDQLKRLCSGSGYGCKALLSRDGRRILVWNAYHAQHFDAWALWNGIPITYNEVGDANFDDAFMEQIALHVTEDGVDSDSTERSSFSNALAVRRMYAQPFEACDDSGCETITP